MILEYTLHWLQQIRAQWQAMLQQLLRGGKQRICVLRLQQLGQQRNGFRVACAIEREKEREMRGKGRKTTIKQMIYGSQKTKKYGEGWGREGRGGLSLSSLSSSSGKQRNLNLKSAVGGRRSSILDSDCHHDIC